MTSTITPELIARRTREFYLSLPLYALVGIGYIFLFRALGAPLTLKAFGLGALGWILALFLRPPIALAVKKLPRERQQFIVGAASGPCEELLRWGLISLTAATFPWAASVGLGWGLVEVIFAVVQGLALTQLLKKDDEKARQARAELEKMGGMNTSSFAGVWERIFATALHIGFTLLVAAMPSLVLLLVVLHSATNLIAVTVAKKSPLATQGIIALSGAGALVAGLLAFNIL